MDSLVSVQLRADFYHSFLIGSSKRFCAPSITRYGVKNSSLCEYSFVELSDSPGGYFGEADFNSYSGIFTIFTKPCLHGDKLKAKQPESINKQDVTKRSQSY
ncbi:hypothetical protein AVEN_111848-1 [Araneus ventricosus]|uniref:Uncharacterized protein n=1 Tax=Araneus ventricosus TaxID=182803 RepID=A0A4Y2BWT1_ARAVE|nr:hypothetical protein AVEN_111848-1 [Araneus ventricosus]